MFWKRRKKGKNMSKKKRDVILGNRKETQQTSFPYGQYDSFGHMGGGSIVYKSTTPKGVWDSDISSDYVKECGNMNKNIKILLTSNLRWKISVLMKVFGNIEWLGYLVPVSNEGSEYDFIFDNILIPFQIVTGTSVDGIDDKEGSLSTSYVIHSHGVHSCLNGFSSTDDDYINDNNDVSILVSGNDVIAEARVKTPCGKLIRMANKDVKVDVSGNISKPISEWKDFLKIIKERIMVEYSETVIRRTNIDEFKKKKGIPKNKKDKHIKKEKTQKEKIENEIEKEIEEFEKDLKKSESPIPLANKSDFGKSEEKTRDNITSGYCYRHHDYYGPEGCEWCAREKEVANNMIPGHCSQPKEWNTDDEEVLSYLDTREVGDSVVRIRDCLDFIESINTKNNINKYIIDIEEEIEHIKGIIS